MTQPIRWAAIALLSGFLLAGCGQKGAKLQQSVVPPDKTLFETGEEYLNKNQYIKARLAYQTLINTYPDSDFTSEAYLSIGDSFYDEGGTQNLLQAEDQYKNFIIFFPTHPKAADAQLKVIAVNMKMMRAPDRDQHYTERAEVEILKFLEQFQGHEYAPIVGRYLEEVRENLALRDFGVGQFYSGRGNYLGAISRFNDIPEKYPNFSQMDEALFGLAGALEKIDQSEAAAVYYGKIAAGYPFSRHFEEAKEKLAGMGKEVPAVDERLAAANQAKLKPSEGFSPLKPLADFAAALGFKGPPDRYEAAVREVAAGKAAAADQRAQDAGADDVLIRATLRQDASGKTEQTAVVGANPKGSEQPTDKKDDKKNENKKPTKPPAD
ncbi:MAG: outer membrane protein assembly factor BamD [Acidobacteria bacterium]|nr:outer membrane protein assembly factor BamD [Acidobacteriota bacterium]